MKRITFLNIVRGLIQSKIIKGQQLGIKLTKDKIKKKLLNFLLQFTARYLISVIHHEK